MKFLYDTNIDFMKHKWLWMGISTALSVVAIVLMLTKGVKQSVEFTGGAEVILRFVEKPQLDELRAKLQAAGLPAATVTTYGESGLEVGVRVGLPERKPGDSLDLDLAQRIALALEPDAIRAQLAAGKVDLNIADQITLAGRMVADAGMSQADADAAAAAIAGFRRENGGVIPGAAQAKALPGLPAAAQGWIETRAFVGPFGLRGQEVIEASVSSEMRDKAFWAMVGAIGGMLAYIWFRFQFQWGLGAVVALVHDTIITLGAFSLMGYEANLPVVAAFLTLIGYSMNDTVVVYDRIRENIKTRGSAAHLYELINDSINQTLSRTLITSVCTWLVVLSLFVFGGPVLRGFSFVILFGIIIGTYSSIYVAAPVLTVWAAFFERRKEAARAKKQGARAASKGAKGARA